MDDLRVAYFSGSYEHILDGVVLTSNRHVAYLVEQQVPVRVFAPTNGVPLLKAAGDFRPVPSIGLPGNPYRLALGLPRKSRRELEEFEPNLVHLASPDWLGLAAMGWARKRKIPVVATFHTRFASYLKHYRVGFLEPLCWRLLRRFYRRCDEVHASCDSLAAELQEHGIPAKSVLPYGVDTDFFSPARRSESWRLAHGFQPEDPVIAFVGRLVWEKGLDAFARSIRKLESEKVRHRVLIVGEGPAREAFQKRLPAAVFTGLLSGPELATAFASADVFFFPSASEAFGCVTIEALASGLPCVVADAPGSRDIVRHGVDGFVCPVGAVDAFSEALASLIRDPAPRQNLRANAIRRALDYGWDRTLQTLLASFLKTVRQSSRQERGKDFSESS